MTHQELIQQLYSSSQIQIHPVSGGDINAVFRVTDENKGKTIVKINDAKTYPQMLAKEERGLNELRKNDALNLPAIQDQGELEGFQYLILEYIEQGQVDASFWPSFGCGLAKLHDITETNFGFNEDNYIGSLQQSNLQCESWTEFLINQRLIPQVKLAVDNDIINREESKQIERIYLEVDDLWPTEKPALLHGDLWSGNYLQGVQNRPYLIDPAVYYGHREMDLGMMHLFGGFDTTLFEFYNETYPLETGWKNRIKYNQLYPLLVHLNLFGKTYFNQIRAIVNPF